MDLHFSFKVLHFYSFSLLPGEGDRTKERGVGRSDGEEGGNSVMSGKFWVRGGGNSAICGKIFFNHFLTKKT